MRAKVFFLSIFFFTSGVIFCQRSRDTLHTVPFDTNKIKAAPYLSLSSKLTGYKDYYIWNDKRTLSEIMNEGAGYFINTFGFGGRNVINYNGFGGNDIGIFRDGIQINDNLFGGFDVENISVNEIDKVEETSNISSFIYGLGSFGKSINIITKDVFQPKPFSQLRYSQDRNGSLYADAFFSLPISKKVNVQAGANNHFIDGLYANTDFSVWRARSRVNFFFNPRFNLRFNFNYTDIKRGLYGGLVYRSDKDSLFDDGAVVKNSDSYEKVTNFYYDADITARLTRNPASLTKVKIYSNNSIRQFRDEENRTNPNGRFITNNFHSIVYGLDVKQNFNVKLSRNVSADILLGGNEYYNLYNFTNVNLDTSADNFGNAVTSLQKNYYSLIAKADFDIKGFFVSGSYKGEMTGKFNHFFGVEGRAPVFKNSSFAVTVKGGYKNAPAEIDYNSFLYTGNNVSLTYLPKNYYEAGAELSGRNFTLEALQYRNDYYGGSLAENGNYSVKLFTKYIDGYLNANKTTFAGYPDWYLKSDVSYHNFFFDNHLNLRTGFNVKYFHEMNPIEYSQYLYSPSGLSNANLKNHIYVDFYLGARIGSANVNLTIANIFNQLYYDTFLYPYDDRGGALNSISRFTIVWDFLN